MFFQVEVAMSILQKHQVQLHEEDVAQAEALRASWTRLQRRTLEHHLELVSVQPIFKKQLLDNLKQFRLDSNVFCADYEINGPMIQVIVQENSVKLGKGTQLPFHHQRNPEELFQLD